MLYSHYRLVYPPDPLPTWQKAVDKMKWENYIRFMWENPELSVILRTLSKPLQPQTVGDERPRLWVERNLRYIAFRTWRDQLLAASNASTGSRDTGGEDVRYIVLFSIAGIDLAYARMAYVDTEGAVSDSAVAPCFNVRNTTNRVIATHREYWKLIGRGMKLDAVVSHSTRWATAHELTSEHFEIYRFPEGFLETFAPTPPTP